MILLILSFIAGVLTVLAPCVLPLLPVIVGSSITGEPSKRKALIITASLGVSIILFTLALKVSTAFINIPQSTWPIISGSIIIIFGIVSLTPEIWEDLAFINRLNISSNKLLSAGYQKKSLWGDILIGVALGPVFSACSPTYFVILASVLPQSFALGLLDLMAYAVGLSLMLLLISFLGQRILQRLGFVSDTHGWFRRLLGLVFIILGILIITGVEKKIEVKLLNNGVFDITKVEQYLLRFNDKGLTAPESIAIKDNDTLPDSDNLSQPKPSLPVKVEIQKLHGPKAPEIVNPSGFINTGLNPDGSPKPITLAQFRGKKVVLLDIWTYSCINCQRTLPYVEAWYEKYKDMGLVVIGLHTPEFAFEKVKANVEDATRRFGLTYPIVMDNDYSTWTAFGNQYWPRKYLISEDGEIIYDHIGEGNYDETERVIQTALSELNSTKVGGAIVTPKNAISFDPTKVKSPEMYFGLNRLEYLSSSQSSSSHSANYLFPSSLKLNNFALEGKWQFSGEKVTLISGPGKIRLKYYSENVYMVAQASKPITITVRLDGDKAGQFAVSNSMLYDLIKSPVSGEHTLEIEIPEGGFEAFTFTFG